MLQDVGNENFKKALLALKYFSIPHVYERVGDTSTFKDKMIFHEKKISRYKRIKRRPMVEGKITKMIPNDLLLCS